MIRYDTMDKKMKRSKLHKIIRALNHNMIKSKKRGGK